MDALISAIVVSASMRSTVRSAAWLMPRVRRYLSFSTMSGPSNAESSPPPARRKRSICHKRSMAWT